MKKTLLAVDAIDWSKSENQSWRSAGKYRQ